MGSIYEDENMVSIAAWITVGVASLSVGLEGLSGTDLVARVVSIAGDAAYVGFSAAGAYSLATSFGVVEA